MNEVDTPQDIFLIDDTVAQLNCAAAENLIFTGEVSTFPSLPRVELRDTGASVCQYASSGLSASCDVRAEANDLRRICCCGTSPSSCPLASDVEVPEPDDDGDDDNGDDNGDSSSKPWTGVLAGLGAVAAAVMLIGAGACGVFGLGFLVGELDSD